MLMTDRDKCIGCKACVMACSFAQKRTFNPLYARIWVLRKESIFLAVPMTCEQCSPSPCRIVCPTKAIIEEPGSGIIKIMSERCIGCKVCMWVCPFRAITLDFEKRVAAKCELCDGDPECVKVCIPKALQYVKAERFLKSKKEEIAQKRIKALKALAVKVKA